MAENAGLAPRDKRCRICKNVAMPEDVTVRILNEDGTVKPAKEAVDYLRSIGLSGSPATLRKWALAHAKHVREYLQTPYPLAPITDRDPIAPDNPHWLDANSAAISVGMEAQRIAGDRLRGGWMEDKDVIALAKIGLTASTVRGGFEARGKGDLTELILRALAGGGPKQLDDGNTIPGEFEEIE